jgi:hypothetical protein
VVHQAVARGVVAVGAGRGKIDDSWLPYIFIETYASQGFLTFCRLFRPAGRNNLQKK